MGGGADVAEPCVRVEKGEPRVTAAHYAAYHGYAVLARFLVDCTGARAEEARVLHFNGPEKPWLVPSSPGPTRQSRSGFDPLQEWRRVYDAAIRRSGEGP